MLCQGRIFFATREHHTRRSRRTDSPTAEVSDSKWGAMGRWLDGAGELHMEILSQANQLLSRESTRTDQSSAYCPLVLPPPTGVLDYQSTSTRGLAFEDWQRCRLAMFHRSNFTECNGVDFKPHVPSTLLHIFSIRYGKGERQAHKQRQAHKRGTLDTNYHCT